MGAFELVRLLGVETVGDAARILLHFSYEITHALHSSTPSMMIRQNYLRLQVFFELEIDES